MSDRPSPHCRAEPANDTDDSELVHRLTETALGGKKGRTTMLNAKRAFDPNVDFSHRAKLLAHLAADQEVRKKPKNLKRYIVLLPIPMAVLLVVTLGGGLARKTKTQSAKQQLTAPTTSKKQKERPVRPSPSSDQEATTHPVDKSKRSPSESSIAQEAKDNSKRTKATSNDAPSNKGESSDYLSPSSR